MKRILLLILSLILIGENAKSQVKKVRINEKIFFISAASGQLKEREWVNGFGVGSEFQFSIQHLVHSYSKTQGDLFRDKPIIILYQPSFRFEKEHPVSFRNSILYSVWKKNKRTGPYSGYEFDHLDAGISFQNEFETRGKQLFGFQLIYKLYIPNGGYNFKRLHFHLGMNYYFGLNEISKSFSGFYGEFALRFRINKISVGGY